MVVAGEVYGAELMPRRRTRLESLTAWATTRRSEVTVDLTGDGVVDIAVIDQRNGGEVVRVSVSAAEAAGMLARIQSDLEELSPAGFDERWGLI